MDLNILRNDSEFKTKDSRQRIPVDCERRYIPKFERLLSFITLEPCLGTCAPKLQSRLIKFDARIDLITLYFYLFFESPNHFFHLCLVLAYAFLVVCIDETKLDLFMCLKILKVVSQGELDVYGGLDEVRRMTKAAWTVFEKVSFRCFLWRSRWMSGWVESRPSTYIEL